MYSTLPFLRTVSAVSIAIFLFASASPSRAIPIRIAVYVPAAIHLDVEVTGSQLNHDLHAIAPSPDIHLDVENDSVQHPDHALHASALVVDVHPNVELISGRPDPNVPAASTYIRPDIEESNIKSSHHDLDYNHEPHDSSLFHDRFVGNAKTHAMSAPHPGEPKYVNDGVVSGLKISSHNPFRALNHASSHSDSFVIQPDTVTSSAEDVHSL
ncbi:hypothetical protein C8J55DRAFT_491777 [Lentinula edodes]|uniref:Uncharacterized protein n=1 Tax=Lentinula lateritia TaxID=40482 RepID=A0A9W9A048_9AGAR|nr:hypothetical protein C8J55DRAFT_491777 [Lentinula edodes]